MQDIELNESSNSFLNAIFGGLAGWALLGSMALFLPGIGVLFTLIAILVAGLYASFTQNKSSLQKKYSEAVKDALLKAFGKYETRQHTLDKIKEKISFRQVITRVFENIFKAYVTQLESAKAQAEDLWTQKKEEKQRQAEEAKEFRVNYIEPAESTIDVYIQEVEAII
jgi:hypothetical protein